MSGIEEYLSQIKNAIYGKDVRQAIHDGIEACYTDGKAGAVDLVARQEIAELVAPSGEAPSAAEVTDARIGADGVTYASLGLATRTQIKTINEDVALLNSANLLSENGSFATTTRNGVTFTFSGKNTCAVTGTPTGYSFCNIFASTSSLPSWLSIGQRYRLTVKSSVPSYVKMAIVFYRNGSQPTTYFETTKEFTIPSDCTGIIIRIVTDSTATGVALNATIEFGLSTNMSNEELTTEAKGITRLEAVSNYTFPSLDEFEIGGINFSSSGWTYGSNVNRVRTKEGTSFSLKAGDIIGLTDYSNSAFLVGIHRSDDTYGATGTLTSDYICPDDGDYAIVLKENPTDYKQTDVSNLAKKLWIKQKDDDITGLHVDRLEDLSDYTFIDDSKWEIGGINFTTEGWTYGSNPNRVRLKEGSFVALKAGDVIGLTDYTDAAFIVGVHRTDGTWGTTGALTSDYICLADGNYSFVLRSMPNDVAQKSKYDLCTRFWIKSYSSQIKTKAKMWNKPILTIIDDDTISINHVTKFYNACKHEGIVGTFASISKYHRNVSGLTELLKSYEDEGFQIVYHCDDQQSYYRPQSEYRDMAEVEQNFSQGLRYLHSLNFLNTDLWVTPYGAHDADLQALAKRKGMKCLISIAQSTYETYPVYSSRWFIPRIGLNQNDSEGSVTLAQLKTKMADCAENNGWLLVGTHFDTWDENIGYDRFYEVVEYAKDLGFDIMTLGEAFEIWRPAYDIKDIFSD